MKTAMILAAGRGERLRPLTNLIPKGLCTVQHIPLIEHHVNNLVKAGFDRLVVNHAYLGGQIRQHLGNGTRFGINIDYAPEPPGGLETGGGLVNALPLLGNNVFLAVNADIFTDYNFANLKLPSNSLAHLVLIDKPAYISKADFSLTAQGTLSNENRSYTFTGIACYSPKLFLNQKYGRYSITTLLRQLAEQGLVTGELYNGKWMDIGEPERLRLANLN